MGMNDDGLTPREHSEMRDILLAGTQRIRPAGARGNRIVAGALALVLIGAVSGAAIATAAIFGTQTTATTPTPSPVETVTPTPVPTPSPTTTSVPPEVPAEAVLPFGGECESALTDAEATTAAGMPMALSDYRWRTGADEVLGGIDCVWLSTEYYAAATVKVFAFPVEVVPSEVSEAVVAGCVDLGYETPTVQCSVAGVVDETWLLVRATGDPSGTTQAGTQAAFDRASANLAAFPAASPAVRTAAWWAPLDCDSLVGQIDAGSYGFERVALLDQQGSTSDGGAAPETIADASRSWCDFHFTAGSGDDSSGEVVRVTIVPGGAIAFPTAAATEDATPFSVAGAQEALIVAGFDRYEGAGSVIVATDGVNVLMVTPDFIRETTDAGPIADTVFAQMHP